MAKKTYDMVEAFNNGTAAWDIDTFLMGPRAPRQSLSDTAKAYDASCAKSTFSWATIAATPTPEGNKIVKYRPSDSIKRAINQKTTPPTSEAREDMRVVWILPWDRNKSLGRVTERIQQGPLLSMVYDPTNNAVCIIFQHGSHAANFLEDNADCVSKTGQSVFGSQHNVIAGDAYPKDHQLSLMEHPTNERRRLTFARSQLFTGNMSELQFKKDIAARVGEHNIELIWLFNSGNATVVFTGTVVARTIRDDFRRLAKNNGPYKDVSVSFSHDPCERPMNLITQIPQNGGSYHSSSPNSYRHSPPGGRSKNNVYGNGSAGSRPSTSNTAQGKGSGGDGWTTIKRR